MTIPGYGGKLLHVNLTTGKVEVEALDETLVKEFIGGFGINNKLAYDLIPPDVDPLSPENGIIVGAGPFSGTLIPCSSELTITTKFPINGAFATACSGGHFAHFLKSSGYDHVVITGRASKPVYLKISDAAVELRDARDLWGKGAVDTDDMLRREYEPCSVIPIGQAGENLVKASITYVDKMHHIGSGGLPAVMGLKNLKAVVVQQGRKPIEIAHRLKLLKVVNHLVERIWNWPDRALNQAFQSGLTTARIFGFSDTERRVAQWKPHDEKWKEAYAGIRRQDYRHVSCAGCYHACRSFAMVHRGEMAGTRCYGVKGVFFIFGSDDPFDEYTLQLKIANALNQYGICVQCFQELYYMVTSFYQKGLLTSEDTGGLELKDDFDTAMKLVELMALRQGFGKLLADGWEAVLQKVGMTTSDWSGLHRGRPMAGPDPRLSGLDTNNFSWITNPRGPHTGLGFSPTYTPGRPVEWMARSSELMGIPPDNIKRIYFDESPFNVGRLNKWGEDWSVMYDIFGLCTGLSRFYSVKTFAELYSALTGINITPAYISKVAERSYAMTRLLNHRAGFSRKDDYIPEAWLKPLKTEKGEFPLRDYHNTAVFNREDMERLLADYYDERGYDEKTGLPTPEKLKELELRL